MAFGITRQQLAERDALAANLREKAVALNAAIGTFNQAIGPLSQPIVDALEEYNSVLEKARTLASSVAEAAHEQFDAKSERWRDGDKGIQVRSWIEEWQMSLDETDLDLPEPLTEIDPDEHASEIEDASPKPTE